MSRAAPCAITTLDSIKRSLVGLRMPRALEVLDATVRRIEQGEIDGLAALDVILTEELTLRENRRVKIRSWRQPCSTDSSTMPW